MGKLSCPKQEAFCREVVKSGNPAVAYQRTYAGFETFIKPVGLLASVLMKQPKIAARLVELGVAPEPPHIVTVESLTAEYEQIRFEAIGKGNLTAAVAAVSGKAKLHGLVVEKQELTGKNGKDLFARNLTDDELTTIIES